MVDYSSFEKEISSLRDEVKEKNRKREKYSNEYFESKERLENKWKDFVLEIIKEVVWDVKVQNSEMTLTTPTPHEIISSLQESKQISFAAKGFDVKINRNKIRLEQIDKVNFQKFLNFIVNNNISLTEKNVI